MRRPIGLRDYVIQATGDPDIFRQARSLGFDGVEVVPTREQLSDPGRVRLGSLKKVKLETGIQVPSLSLSHHNQGGLVSPDEKTSEAAVDDVWHCFEWAEVLGVGIFLVPFFNEASLGNSDSRKRVVARLRPLCAEAERRGVILAYEGDLPAQGILEVAAEIGSPAFGCYFDLANPLFHGLEPWQELEKLGPLVVSVHIKDFKEHLGDCRPGQGRVPLGACADLLRQMGYAGWLILETPPASPEVVAGDLEFVKKVFGQ